MRHRSIVSTTTTSSCTRYRNNFVLFFPKNYNESLIRKGVVLSAADAAADARADEVARNLRRALAVANRYVDSLTIVCERVVRVALRIRDSNRNFHHFFTVLSGL